MSRPIAAARIGRAARCSLASGGVDPVCRGVITDALRGASIGRKLGTSTPTLYRDYFRSGRGFAWPRDRERTGWSAPRRRRERVDGVRLLADAIRLAVLQDMADTCMHVCGRVTEDITRRGRGWRMLLYICPRRSGIRKPEVVRAHTSEARALVESLKHLQREMPVRLSR